VVIRTPEPRGWQRTKFGLLVPGVRHRPRVPCYAPDVYREPQHAFAFVNSASNLATGAGTTLDVTYSATAGSLLVGWCKHEGGAGALTVARSDGTEAWSLGTLVAHSNGDLHARFAYLLSCTGGASVTYRMTTGSTPFRSFHLYEFSYSGTSSLDVQNTGQGSSTAPTSGNVTTTGTDEVALGGYGEYSTIVVTTPEINATAADGSIIFNSGNFTASWYRLLSATFAGGHANCTIPGGAGQDWICNVIAFKAVAGGGTTRGTPFGHRGTAFNGGRTYHGIIQ
jgi:hypothetical protein